MAICKNIIKSGVRKGQPCGITKCGRHHKKEKLINPATPLDLKNEPVPNHPNKVAIVKKLPGHMDLTNQVKVAQEAIALFRDQRHFVIMTAQTQSGKTGAAKQVITLFSEGFGHNFIPILLIPVNDNGILNQAYREFDGLIDHDYILSIPQMLEKTRIANIMAKSPDYKILIIIDESHMGATITENGTTCLLEILANAQINPNGTYAPEKCYILSVSATPNAEIAGLIGLNSSNGEKKKDRVILRPGAGYYGIADMFNLDRVHPAFDLKTEEQKVKLSQLIATKYSGIHKYILIRVKSIADSDIFSRILQEHLENPRIIQYDQKHEGKDKLKEYLDTSPERLTIILLIHRCRASMQLNTQHIAMVHENPDAEIDVTTQGLPGRMCGYGKAEHGVDIYCNQQALKTQLNWINSDFSTFSVPTCKNVDGGVGTLEYSTDHWEPCLPTHGQLDPLLLQQLEKELSPTGISKLTTAFYNKKPVIQNIKATILTPNHGQQPIKGNGMMIIKSNTSTSLNKFWVSKTSHITHNEAHYGFETSSLKGDIPQFLNKRGYFIYINMSQGHQDYGHYRIYSTQSHLSGLRQKRSLPATNSINHLKHSRAVVKSAKIQLKFRAIKITIGLKNSKIVIKIK
jgi:hypothetical protein